MNDFICTVCKLPTARIEACVVAGSPDLLCPPCFSEKAKKACAAAAENVRKDTESLDTSIPCENCDAPMQVGESALFEGSASGKIYRICKTCAASVKTKTDGWNEARIRLGVRDTDGNVGVAGQVLLSDGEGGTKWYGGSVPHRGEAAKPAEACQRAAKALPGPRYPTAGEQFVPVGVPQQSAVPGLTGIPTIREYRERKQRHRDRHQEFMNGLPEHLRRDVNIAAMAQEYAQSDVSLENGLKAAMIVLADKLSETVAIAATALLTNAPQVFQFYPEPLSKESETDRKNMPMARDPVLAALFNQPVPEDDVTPAS